MKDNKILELTLKGIKTRFPKFCLEESGKRAFEQCSYMETFPEAYRDNNFDVEELKEQLDDLRYGFAALFNFLSCLSPMFTKQIVADKE